MEVQTFDYIQKSNGSFKEFSSDSNKNVAFDFHYFKKRIMCACLNMCMKRRQFIYFSAQNILN